MPSLKMHSPDSQLFDLRLRSRKAKRPIAATPATPAMINPVLVSAKEREREKGKDIDSSNTSNSSNDQPCVGICEGER